MDLIPNLFADGPQGQLGNPNQDLPPTQAECPNQVPTQAESNLPNEENLLENILCCPDLLFANTDRNEPEQEAALDLTQKSSSQQEDHTDSDQDSSDPDADEDNVDEEPEIANLALCLTNIKAWNDPAKAPEKQRLLMCHYRKGLRLSKQNDRLRKNDHKQATKIKQLKEIIKRLKIVNRSQEKTIKDILGG
jgi:hypothetical protein